MGGWAAGIIMGGGSMGLSSTHPLIDIFITYSDFKTSIVEYDFRNYMNLVL